jgi:hypothetical protein
MSGSTSTRVKDGCVVSGGEALAHAQTAGGMREPPGCRGASGTVRLRSDTLGAAIYGAPERTGPAATVRAGTGARVHPLPDAASPPGAAFAAARVAVQSRGTATADALLAPRAAGVEFPDHARPQRAAAGRTAPAGAGAGTALAGHADATVLGLLAGLEFLLGRDPLNPCRRASPRPRSPASARRRVLAAPKVLAKESKRSGSMSDDPPEVAAVEASCRSGGRHRQLFTSGFLSPHSSTERAAPPRLMRPDHRRESWDVWRDGHTGEGRLRRKAE